MHLELICKEFLSFAFAFSQCLEGNTSVLQYQPKEQLWIEKIVPSVYIPPVMTSSPCCQFLFSILFSYMYLKQMKESF